VNNTPYPVGFYFLNQGKGHAENVKNPPKNKKVDSFSKTVIN
jgi:hypothetical protein